MDYKIEAEKLILSMTASLAAAAAGNSLSARLLILLLLLMLFDTLLGWARALKNKEWKSSKARWGSIGKLIQLGFVSFAYTLDWVFGIDVLKYAFAAYFCLVEVGSICENAYYMGVEIPLEWVEVAKKSKNYAGRMVLDKAKAVITAMKGRV